MDFKFINEIKNTSKKSSTKYVLEKDFYFFKIANEDNADGAIPQVIPKGVIQFFFCFEGWAKFNFGPHYARELKNNESMLLYNPSMDLPHKIDVKPGAKMIFMLISPERLHQLFVHDTDEFPFLKGENLKDKVYEQNEMNAMLSLCLSQIFDHRLDNVSNNLYMKGKALELLSLYFKKSEKGYADNCPFLRDQSNVDKIIQSKNIIIERMASPPNMKELAKEIGLNEYQLKVGFKNIYGQSVTAYLNDYKLSQSLKMLDSGTYKVKDVAYALGYTNPSHYISAFKKKYGITPKKHLMT
ncbi:MAG: helix-turn-helix transcriptional regulator [Bacteroidota bacterium]